MQQNADPLVADSLSALFGLISRSHAIDGPVSRGDYALLALARALGPRRAGDLAEKAGLDPSTTSRRVSALVERGYLDRTPDPDDGRAHRIALTPEGRAVLDAERQRRVDLVGVALEDWPEPERRDLADLLARLQTSLARVAGADLRSRSVAGSSSVPERTPA